MTSLDRTDVALLAELARDADRPNVEIARAIGLSPSATLQRRRRLTDAGVIRAVRADVDAQALGYGLRALITIALARHDEESDTRFERAVRALPLVTAAWWVTGDVDVVLIVVASDPQQLHEVLTLLGRAGAGKIVTHLMVKEMKPASTMPPLRRERPGRD